MRLIIDTNGGDNSPDAQILAGVRAANELETEIIFVGDKTRINNTLSKLNYKASAISVVDAPEFISNNEPPVEALKRKPNASVAVASKMLKNKGADALITSGSTGAMLVCGQLIVGRIKGIKRPALAPVIPTDKGGKLLIDSGANTNCSPINLLQFGKMGSIYMQNTMGEKIPRVGLLSNGEEDEKGSALVKEAHQLLACDKNLNFIGNIEGRDIMYGIADVIVCDGFLGNVVLKTIEGTASYISGEVKKIFKKNIFTMLSSLPVIGGINNFKKRMDYREYGGAPLLGVNATMIKAHGASDEVAFYNAIKQAYNTVDKRVVEKIIQSI